MCEMWRDSKRGMRACEAGQRWHTQEHTVAIALKSLAWFRISIALCKICSSSLHDSLFSAMSSASRRRISNRWGWYNSRTNSACNSFFILLKPTVLLLSEEVAEREEGKEEEDEVMPEYNSWSYYCWWESEQSMLSSISQHCRWQFMIQFGDRIKMMPLLLLLLSFWFLLVRCLFFLFFFLWWNPLDGFE